MGVLYAVCVITLRATSALRTIGMTLGFALGGAGSTPSPAQQRSPGLLETELIPPTPDPPNPTAGPGIVLHGVFRTPNLKARLTNYHEEFRAVWRGYNEHA